MTDPVLQFRLDVAITPKGQGRPRFNAASSRAYTPKTTRDYVDALRAAAMTQWSDAPLEGPLKVSVVALMPLPKSARGRTHHLQKPDLDNIVKAAIDALLPHKTWPGVFADDCQIVSLKARKDWAVDGALSICVWSLA